jgi:hypothetical protein
VRVIFPVILVVFGVGEDVFDIDAAVRVDDIDDQAVAVAFDVEDLID